MYKFMKYILIGLGVFIIAIFGLKACTALKVSTTKKSPVVGIEAANEKIYIANAEIEADDFQVVEVHENGSGIKLSEDQFTFFPNVASRTGAYTVVTITSVDDPELSCEVEVQNKRAEIESFEIGYPNLSDVVATIYSNGELEFTGTGNVKNYDPDDMPWKTYADSRDNPITSVVFNDGVEPVSLDYWFEDEEYLVYVNKIPSSVQSMEGTFAGCISLEEGPDWSACTSLTNLNSTFEGDESLKHIYPIPACATMMNFMCKDCISLEETPDMSAATGIIYMQNSFQSCTSLNTVGQLPPNLLYMDNSFEDCINLVKAPEIPGTVLGMSNAFNGCTRMTTASTIPGAVQDIAGTYSDCPKLCGSICINANPNTYGSFLRGSVVSVSLDVTGSSQMLNIIALTKDDTANITVNGNAPVKE